MCYSKTQSLSDSNYKNFAKLRKLSVAKYAHLKIAKIYFFGSHVMIPSVLAFVNLRKVWKWRPINNINWTGYNV